MSEQREFERLLQEAVEQKMTLEETHRQLIACATPERPAWWISQEYWRRVFQARDARAAREASPEAQAEPYTPGQYRRARGVLRPFEEGDHTQAEHE